VTQQTPEHAYTARLALLRWAPPTAPTTVPNHPRRGNLEAATFTPGYPSSLMGGKGVVPDVRHTLCRV